MNKFNHFAVISFFICSFLFSSAFAGSLDPELITQLKVQLQQINKADQDTRQEIQHSLATYSRDSAEVKALWKKQSEIDAQNRNRIAIILDTYGWPELNEFGDLGAARAILLVIQHADLEYQLRYFDLAKQAVQHGNLQPSLFALLEDRVLIRQGKKQLYGTQVHFDKVSGVAYFPPIEDEENVDIRRAAIGLEPIAEYGSHYGIDYKKIK